MANYVLEQVLEAARAVVTEEGYIPQTDEAARKLSRLSLALRLYDRGDGLTNERPAPFNAGGNEDDEEIAKRIRRAFESVEPPPSISLLIHALSSLMFASESIRLELLTGREHLLNRVIEVKQVLADKLIPSDDNNAVYTLSKDGRDTLLTALATDQTLIVRVTRGVA